MSSKPTKTNKKSCGHPNNDYAKKWKDTKSLQKRIDSYFVLCDTNEKPYTMTGLAIALDIDRKTLYNYSNDEQFSPLIKKAKAKVEEQLVTNALMGKANPTFTIFNLKNNFDWVDKQEKQVELSGSVESYFKENPLNA